MRVSGQQVLPARHSSRQQSYQKPEVCIAKLEAHDTSVAYCRSAREPPGKMPDSSVPGGLKIELSVHELGLPVSPLPKGVRNRWQNWSPEKRLPEVTLERVKEKHRLAEERRKARRANQTVKRQRPSATSPSEKRHHKARILKEKLQVAETRRQHSLEQKIIKLTQQHYSVEVRRKAAVLRRRRAVRILQRQWDSFAQRKSSTAQLAANFISTGALSIAGLKVPDVVFAPAPAMPKASPSPFLEEMSTFEAVAEVMQSPKTLSALQALLRRFSVWRKLQGDTKSDTLAEPLLRRLYPKIPKDKTLPHYHPRVMLSSIMISTHPEVVFNLQDGSLQEELMAAAREMLTNLQLLLALLTSEDPSADSDHTFHGCLKAWDDSWVNYLSSFVVWKLRDAAALEQELIGIAVKMEISMLDKCGADPESADGQSNPTLQDIAFQVKEDHTLLRQRIMKLSGPVGVERMDTAVSEARAAFRERQQQQQQEEEEKEKAAYPDDAQDETDGTRCLVSAGSQPYQQDGGRSPTWAVARDSVGGMSNEAMVHEMLYSPGWQLPAADLEAAWDLAKAAAQQDEPLKSMPELNLQSLQAAGPEAMAQAMRTHVARVAEQAFWDSIEQGLGGSSAAGLPQGGGVSPRAPGNGGSQTAERLAALLAELAQEVVKVLPTEREGSTGSLASEISASFAAPSLAEAIIGQGPQVVGQLLLQTVSMMERLGSPGREADIEAAQALIQQQFETAASGAPSAPTTARVTSRALRLLFAQMRLLKLDAANARLRMLSAAISGGESLTYSASRFQERFGLVTAERPQMDSAILKEKLPRTTSWMRVGAQAAASVEANLLAAGLDPMSSQPSAVSAVPTDMRAGRSGPQGVLPAQGDSLGVARIASAPAGSWKAAVRVGLVGLITSETPAAGAGLAETLELDAKRLHYCQNELQRILVLSACMILHQQTLTATGGTAGGGASATKSVKSRLSHILLDPSLGLKDVAAELSRSSGGAASEETLLSALQNLLSPGGALQALMAGLGSALCLHMLFPGQQAEATAVDAELSKALARCGGTALKQDVSTLASSLAEVAAVTEAVHGLVYSVLYASLTNP